jgi:hypothetical protein
MTLNQRYYIVKQLKENPKYAEIINIPSDEDLKFLLEDQPDGFYRKFFALDYNKKWKEMKEWLSSFDARFNLELNK